MTNTPTPNPNRRRRLTADELIAVIVALAGIGGILFWTLGLKNPGLNLAGWNSGSLLGNANSSGDRGSIGLAGAGNNNDGRVSGGMNGTEESAPPTRTNAGINPINPLLPGAVIGGATIAGGAAANADKSKIILDEEKNERKAPKTEPAAVTPPPATAEAPATPAAPMPITNPSPKAFKDVPQTFWGEDYITELQKRGVLDDFGTGKFDPNQPITRGEFAKMLDRAYKERNVGNTKQGFKDIPTEFKRKDAIDRSVNLGFMTGYSKTKFQPNQAIPRYQMQISLAKGLKLAPTSNPDDILKDYQGLDDMPKYAREKVASAVAADIKIKDEQPTNLRSMKNATRADAAALIYQALLKEGKIKPPAKDQDSSPNLDTAPQPSPAN
jgi:hypothetical protein